MDNKPIRRRLQAVVALLMFGFLELNERKI